MVSVMTRPLVLALVGFGIAWPLPGRAQIAGAHQAYLEATKLETKGDLEGALAKVNESLQQDPGNVKAYVLRGDIYSKQQQWILAEQDFSTALKMNQGNPLATFNLAEIKLMQKKFHAARPGFLELIYDTDLGDLAAYKVFLCDLYGGDQTAAQAELNAFDQAQDKASYYYAHAAWTLYNRKPDDARTWLDSAAHIYSPEKSHAYISTLQELGYLPLPRR